MKPGVQPVRVLAKALFLFVLSNLLFALVDPPVGKLTLYNSLFPGRLRFPYEQKANLFFLGYNAPVFEDFDAMFGTHIISQRKPEHEFRLILLGDSATWGYGLEAREMLSEQINHLHLQACDGREIRAYNLSYPLSSVTRDLLVLEKAMEYQPDMILWLVTLSALVPHATETQFVVSHPEQYLNLVKTHRLRTSHLTEPVQPPSFWDKTLIGQSKRLKNLALTQAFGLLWAATGIDHYQGLQPEPELPSPDVEDNLDYEGFLPVGQTALFDSLATDVLSAASTVAKDAPIVLVNEPIFVADGQNHDVRYNGLYPRWAYDHYREFMVEWAEQRDLPWLDYWNALPREDFADANFHRRESGEERFARLLAPDIQRLVCS